jgi:molecular chaperone GrpE
MSQKKKPNPAETPDMEKAPGGEQTESAASPTPGETVESGKKEPTAESRIQELERQSAENLDKFLRAKAETENIRRRAEIDVANAHKYGIERFAAEMLAVRDSLELAKTVDLKDGGVIEKVLEGLDLTLKLMDTALQKFGLTVIDPQGQKFDPEKHQAMSAMETDQMPPNHVLKVMQKGYLLNNRLLRPAMVIVSKTKAQDSEKPAAS